MDNHPIPQDVTGFKFRVIGSITIKQFLYLLGSGIAAAILIFLIPMNLILKIPLVVLLGGIGPFFAFIPIEGRPADLMLTNFFKAVFTNSVYFYQKQGANLALFPALNFTTAAAASSQRAQSAQQSKSDVKRAMLARTLRSSTYAPDAAETQRIKDINSIFGNGGVGTSPTPPQPPSPSIARPPVSVDGDPANTESAAQVAPVAKPVPSLVVESADSTQPQTAGGKQQTTDNSQQAANSEHQPRPQVAQSVAGTHNGQDQPNQSSATSDQNQQANQTPQQSAAQVTPPQTPTPTSQQGTQTKTEPQRPPQQQVAPSPSSQMGPSPQSGSSYFDELPDRPNVVLGVVLSPRGKALGNIIVEVQDSTGTSVRTLKTDMQGKFAAATALPDGEYTFVFEDPRGINMFDTMKVRLNGAIFQPVVAKSSDAREELRKNLFGG